MSNKEQVIFSTEEMNNMIKDSLQFQQNGPVTCLGREFPNDQALQKVLGSYSVSLHLSAFRPQNLTKS